MSLLSVLLEVDSIILLRLLRLIIVELTVIHECIARDVESHLDFVLRNVNDLEGSPDFLTLATEELLCSSIRLSHNQSLLCLYSAAFVVRSGTLLSTGEHEVSGLLVESDLLESDLV